jgi:hypothetical protein
MHGLTNHREYYSAHYFAELLSGDLKDTCDQWKATALEHPDSEDHREPNVVALRKTAELGLES